MPSPATAFAEMESLRFGFGLGLGGEGERSQLHLCNPQSASDMRMSQDRGSPNDGKRGYNLLNRAPPPPTHA